MHPVKETVLPPKTKLVLQQFRCDISGIREVSKGQITEENLHRCVEFEVALNDQDHSQIPHHCNVAYSQECRKQGHMQVWVFFYLKEKKRRTA